MFNLPKNTEMNKQLPKSRLFERLDLTSKQKSIIDKSISSLYIVNNISEKTISQIQTSAEVESLYFILANLKDDGDIKDVSEIIFKFIPQKIILILKYDNKYRLACFYEKIIISDHIDENYSISLQGLNLDKIYQNIVAEIGNITIKDDYTLKEQIEENDKIETINNEIKILENKCKNEKQFNKKVKINKKINELKIELSRYQV